MKCKNTVLKEKLEHTERTRKQVENIPLLIKPGITGFLPVVGFTFSLHTDHNNAFLMEEGNL